MVLSNFQYVLNVLMNFLIGFMLKRIFGEKRKLKCPKCGHEFEDEEEIALIYEKYALAIKNMDVKKYVKK